MSDKAVRALWVLGSLSRGGAETWATQMLEQLDRSRVQVDIVVHRAGGAYEERARAAGANIFYGGSPSQLLRYQADMRRLFQGYQVVHSHLQLYSGFIMFLAHQAGIQVRIAHARNSHDGHGQQLPRVVYRELMRYCVKRYATHLYAVSSEAALGAFWKGVTADNRFRLMTGIDLSPFATLTEKSAARKSLGLPDDALIIGHVGSFREQKNHRFLVEVAHEIIQKRSDALIVLVGSGELRQGIEERVAALGIAAHFRFLGEQDDIPQVLCTFDAFLFPSLYEGLPRALVEAQAAGVPCVASRTISAEAAAFPESVIYLPLSDAPSHWANTVLQQATTPRAPTWARDVLQRLETMGLSIASNAQELTTLYETTTNSTR